MAGHINLTIDVA